MRLDVRNGNGWYKFHTTRYSNVPTSVRSTAPPTSLNEFDANGNLVFDVDRNMQLHYSLRNLPLDIVFDEGLIRNTYRPDGTKTSKKVYDAKERLATNETYLGSLVLNFGVPSQILHPEGVVDVSNLSQPVVHYHLKDQASTTLSSSLGNVRAVVNPSATSTALISQTNDYYPFGMCYTKNPGSFTNKRKYDGKEEQEMPGRWLDYGARFYDPQLGRWHSVDPLAEKYRRWTPYNYCVNNPMRFVDPDGMGPWDQIIGSAVGVITNLTNPIVSTTVRDGVANSSLVINTTDYNNGLTSADQTCLVGGAFMAANGLNNTSVGIAAIPETGPVGIGVAIAGAAETTLGGVLTVNASNNLAVGNNYSKKGQKNLVAEAKQSQAKNEAAAERQAKRETQTKRGNSRTGNSNKTVKGEHNNLSNGKSSKDDHEKLMQDE